MSSAKPVNSASTVSVEAGTQTVTVAKCESANGLPAAKISWVTTAKGNETTTTKAGTDNTVTVTSEYRMVPTSADNGKDISCVVAHRTLEKPESFKMKLAVLCKPPHRHAPLCLHKFLCCSCSNVQFMCPPTVAPEVSIAGYDNNWYIGRTSTVLTCQATANPVPTSVLWKTWVAAQNWIFVFSVALPSFLLSLAFFFSFYTSLPDSQPLNSRKSPALIIASAEACSNGDGCIIFHKENCQKI